MAPTCQDVQIPPELQGCSIVYFGNDFFAENRTSAHHIARRLGQHFPILYVETPGLRAPKASGRDLNKIVDKLQKATEPPRQLDERFWHMTIPQIPFRGLPGVSAVNKQASVAIMRSRLEKLGFDRPILWFTVPHAGGVLGRLHERLSVYYVVDDYGALPDVNAAQVRAMDADMTARSSLLFTVSLHLTEAKGAQHKDVVYSPHGVDVDHFAKAQEGPLPEAVRRLQKPVVGYFGVLDNRMDTALLDHLARSRPEWTFLFVGRVATELGALASRPNAVFTGAVKYEQLPEYARAFDVCLMPYRMDEFARAANPLKLREYLATANPVVSAPLRETQPFAEHLLLASTPEEYLQQLERALDQDSAELRAKRLAAVAQMSWDKRFEEILEHVAARLKRAS